MADVQVKFVSKLSPHHDKVTHLGGDAWTWSSADVIASIEAKTNTFFTLQNGARATVAVVNGTTGKYLRTHADGKWTDNLLALPPCRSVA